MCFFEPLSLNLHIPTQTIKIFLLTTFNESDYEEESVKDIEYEEKNVESEKISTKNICDSVNHDESEEEKIEIYNEGHVIYN